MKHFRTLSGVAAIALMASAGVASATTLEDVQARGTLNCGVTTGLAGFASPDDQGNWTGLDVDMCRAVAAAVLGDSEAVKYVPTTATERFTALQSGEVDLLARNTTWTFSRDVQLGFEFVGVNYYDGQGFMVRSELGVASALELDGASVCVQTGTTTELNLADYFRANNMELNSIVFQKNEEARQAYDEGRCDAYTTDASGLAAERSVLTAPGDHIILPEIISKEPLGPLVRHGDNQWGDIVRWTLNSMIIAEEFGVTSENVEEMKGSENPEVQRLLGVEKVEEGQARMGSMLGLSDEWAYNIISMVGNYGESFEAHVGVKTPLGLARGLNQLWSKGGLLYAPPMR
ncbi:MAG: amino acid ABC transporter substrate-binding protein [Rhodospirillaceae bacterium]|nr:amino acid ABC transporter substrate-binding protein [Rhodospirillaceae bacterium]